MLPCTLSFALLLSASYPPGALAQTAEVDAGSPAAPRGAQEPRYTEFQNPAFPTALELAQPEPVPERSYLAEDFAAYFSEGVLAEAKAQFDRGRHLEARALLQPVPQTPPVRYLRALAALRAEDNAAAAEEFSSLAADYPALSDRCLTHAGSASERLKRFDVAARFYSQVPVTSRLHSDARLGLYRVLRKQGDLPGALQALEPLTKLSAPFWGRDLGAEALLQAADLHRQRKDSKAEAAALVLLWSRHPLSPLLVQVEPRMKDLKGATPSLAAKVDRAETLIEAHRNQQGIAVLEPLLGELKLPDPLACRARFALGKGWRKERLHSKAVAQLAPVTERCADPDLKARAMYVLGSSRSIVDLARGAKTYTDLAAEFPKHSFADDALFYAADLHLKVGDPDSALARLQQVSDQYADGDFLAESLFKAFWIHRSRGAVDKALATLDTIELRFADAEEGFELERARYWRARVLESMGEKQKAAAVLERLAIDYPAGYYGLVARSRLSTLDPEASARVSTALVFPVISSGAWPVRIGPLARDPHFLAGVELLRMGLLDSVAPELLSASRSKAPVEAIRLIAQLLSTAGDTRAAHSIARMALRRDLSGRVTEGTRRVWELAYPNAFRDSVEKHCKSAEVDPDLLQALMREESALDPKALSWAGALGLTQLMPGTAKGVAQQLKLRKVTQASLLEPDLNIRLGSYYLGTLLRQWKGNKAYALASYNAGARSVAKWRDARPDAELDEWVEEIPIAETRGYVKRVLRTYNTYQLLYARSLPVMTVSR